MKKKKYINPYVKWRALSSEALAIAPKLLSNPDAFVLVTMGLLIPVIFSAALLAYATLLRLNQLEQAQADCLTVVLNQLEQEPPTVHKKKMQLTRSVQSLGLQLNGHTFFSERSVECGAEFIDQNGDRSYFLIPGKS